MIEATALPEQLRLAEERARAVAAAARPLIEAELREQIAAEPLLFWADRGRQGGQVCLRGTRLPVQIVVDFLLNGFSDTEIVDAYPSVTPEVLAHLRTWLVDTDGTRRGGASDAQ